ncbi:MAG: glycosyltransferase family 39 protein [Hormoscilla sp.]
MKSKFQFSIIVLLLLGVFFRFINIDGKIYWLDETFTSLRVSGYTATELVEIIPKYQVLTVEELQKYYHPSPERDFTDVAKALAGNAEHAPLYFVMVRFWREWFGSSVAATRSLSAVISLLTLPCIYWLCIELFESSLTGWVAVGLLAISPFQVLYAQEARQYSLYIVVTLLSSAALLRSLRLQKQSTDLKSRIKNWGLYAVTLAFGFYTHLLFALVAMAHVVYVLYMEGKRFSQTIKAYFLASLVGVLAFVPWIMVIIVNLKKVIYATSWQNQPQRPPLTLYVKSWLGNITRQFVDFGLSSDNSSLAVKAFIPIIIIIVLLFIYAVYFAYKYSPKRIFLFLVTLSVVPWLVLALPDLISGSTRSNVQRYIIPCFLGIQLAVAYLLATCSANRHRSWLPKVMMVTLFSLGIISCSMSAQAETWWNKRSDSNVLEVAPIINQSSHPLVITKAKGGMRIAPLSYRLDPDVNILLIQSSLPDIPEGFREVFLYAPGPTLISEIEQQYNFVPVSKSENPRTGLAWLWKLER